MSKTTSLLSALLCTFIWGTTFIAQDTGMDNIGPFTFNAVRFFIGFLAITPLVLLFELKKFKSEFKSDVKTFITLSMAPTFHLVPKSTLYASCLPPPSQLIKMPWH